RGAELAGVERHHGIARRVRDGPAVGRAGRRRLAGELKAYARGIKPDDDGLYPGHDPDGGQLHRAPFHAPEPLFPLHTVRPGPGRGRRPRRQEYDRRRHRDHRRAAGRAGPSPETHALWSSSVYGRSRSRLALSTSASELVSIMPPLDRPLLAT